MSRCCEKIQPLLFRVDEGEATPEQAMRVAQHLSDCTACRITCARERRLAEFLSSELEELPVGEEFLDTVMATLPKELPKRSRPPRRRNWRGLKLACFGGMMGLLTLPGIPGMPADPGLPGWALPRLTVENAPVFSEGVGGFVQIVAAAANAFVGGGGLPALSAATVVGLLASVALAGMVAVAGASAVCALAARSLLRFG